jgi:ABC-type transport system involved in multi-copper enzyme maturation permease subunit
MLCYRSIAGERESGSVKFLLGLPLTRSEVFVGKLVGHAIGVVVPVLIGLMILMVVGIIRHGLFSPSVFLAVFTVTMLYTAALVSIVVSVSAIASRPINAAGVLVAGFLIILELAWQSFASLLTDLLAATPIIDSGTAGVRILLTRLSPSRAYNVVTNWILGVGNSADPYQFVLLEQQPATSAGAVVVKDVFSAGAPIYLHETLSVIVLVLWLIGPAGIALHTFRKGDLV